MKIIAIAVLMAGTATWGQEIIAVKPCPAGQYFTGAVAANGDPVCKNPPPLKCAKYEHIEPTHYGCEFGSNGGVAFCDKIVPEQCVPDLHMVTEKEWQELMARQARLQSAIEHLLSAMEHQSNFDDKLLKEKE